jgi:hypothetical protein
MIRNATDQGALVVDLNNFARFPTLPVGLMVAVLRAAGIHTRVLSPLAVGMPGLPRGGRAQPWGYWDERLRWWSATTPSPGVRRARRWVAERMRRRREARSGELLLVFERALEQRPGVVLVSTYLMHHRLIEALAARAAARGVPFVVGGPAFTHGEVRREWLAIPGVSAVVAAECEPILPALVRAAVRGDDLAQLPGVATPARPEVPPAAPIEDLDALPHPDYSDFPWDRYPNRVVSMLAGRGCGWGRCTFCSDVQMVGGRGFRSRSPERVLDELAYQWREHGARLFCFSDLKLNSNLEVWEALAARFPAEIPDPRWTAAVHTGGKGAQGLDPDHLFAARSAGLVRVTTGLETGSQRLLDRMRKGTTVEELERFVRAASVADISVRATMFTGYPGEEPDDLEASASFLERHADHLERIHLSRFLIQPGTPIERDIAASPGDFPEIEGLFGRARVAEIEHVNSATQSGPYRRALARLLRAAHRINRKPLRPAAAELEGTM